MKFYCNIATLICLHIDNTYFHTTVTEFSACDRDSMFTFSTHNTSDTKYVGIFSHTNQFSNSRQHLGVPQFSSEANHPELVRTPG